METTYLSIKEAAEKYKKAEITVRRLVRAIVNDDHSEDRGMISPPPSKATKLKAKRKPFSYSVDTALLEKHFGASTGAPRAMRLEHGPQYIRLLEQTTDTLQKQMDVKDEQIKSLQASIQGLS